MFRLSVYVAQVLCQLTECDRSMLVGVRSEVDF